MNARCSPERVLSVQSSDQFARLPIDTRATTARSSLPAPTGAETFPVPAQHRLRPDDDQSSSPAGPDPRKPDPEHAVEPRQAHPAPAEPLPQHRDLVTQRDNLRLRGCSGAEQITQDADKEAKHRARAFLQRRLTSMIEVRMGFPGGTAAETILDPAAPRT